MTTPLAGPSAHTTKTSHSYRLNARTWAKKFSARLLEPGVVSYTDMGCGVALLRKETIDKCINSFVGRPVVINHKKMSPGNMKTVGHGYITHVSYNDKDGWWYGEGVVDSDEAVAAIQRAGFGSVGYTVNATRPGGEHHMIKYHEEITDFSGEHLAIVDNPRYEGATIRLNSKKNKKPMFKLFKKSATRDNAVDEAAAKAAAEKLAAEKAAAEAAKTRENSAPADLQAETEIEIAEGEKVTIGELVEVYNARNAEADLSPEDEVTIGEERVPLKDLIGAWNSKQEAEKKAKEEPKQPGAGIYRLVNAKNRPDVETVPGQVATRESKLARGAEKYGSTKAK